MTSRPWRLEAQRRDRYGAPTDVWFVVATYATEDRAEKAKRGFSWYGTLRVRPGMGAIR